MKNIHIPSNVTIILENMNIVEGNNKLHFFINASISLLIDGIFIKASEIPDIINEIPFKINIPKIPIQ